jgi:hypothetical protein
MAGEKDDGFQDLDLEADGDKEEIEVVDKPETAETTQKPKESKPKDSEELSPEEVSQRVQKRINTLTLRAKSAEEREAALLNRIQALESQRKVAVQTAEKAVTDGYDVAEKALKDKIEQGKVAFKAAYDSGDKDALADAQLAIAEASAELKFVQAQKANRPAAVQEGDEDKGSEKPPVQRPQYDPKAVAWAKENSWFGKDRTMTAVAMAVDAALKDEGWDPRSDDYYEEVDRRLREELPHKFKDEDDGAEEVVEKKPQRRQVVQGRSRGLTTNGRTVVHIDENQKRIANTMGMTPVEYAKQMVRDEKNQTDQGYTVIDID